MRPSFRTLWIPILAGLVVLGSAPRGVATVLDEAQRDGYRVWLHNLETTIEARRDHGEDAPRPLFPFDLLEAPGGATADSLSLLVVARELNELEDRPRLLQEPADKTALHALIRARNHRNIAEYDTALHWYAEASRRDSTAAFARELGPERMAVAVAAGDSATVARLLEDALAARTPAARSGELVLAYRFLVARADTTNVDRLATVLESRPEGVTGDLAFWHAFALNWRGRWAESLPWLLGLLDDDGFSHGLTEAQRAWLLAAIPDQLVLTGHTAEAGPLYRVLAASGLPGTSEWARCQAAVLDFLAGRYLEAGTAFEDLCDRRESHPWQEYACGMRRISDRMERLRNEGNTHGAASHYDH